MSDIFDQAQDTEANETAAALLRQQMKAAATPHPDPTGECMNPLCCEPLDPPKLYCGPKCAQEHARRMK